MAATLNMMPADRWSEGCPRHAEITPLECRARSNPAWHTAAGRIVTAAAAVALVVFGWLGSREQNEIAAPNKVAAKLVAQKHYVTPIQLMECGALAKRRIESFRAVAQDGTPFQWPEAHGARPLVVIFIKQGCPCSVDFEPFFHRLELQYRGAALFVGVIDGEADVARAYALENKVPYPVLTDPDRALIAQFGAKHGGYVALLSTDRQLDTLWPGCSAEMMRSLGSRIAVIRAIAERPLDVSGMPKVLTTGCPFAS
jgi:peroxiredoxin